MEIKKESNILTEEEPKYIISLKKRYRILDIVQMIAKADEDMQKSE